MSCVAPVDLVDVHRLGEAVGDVVDRVDTLVLEPLNAGLRSRRLMAALGMFPSFENLDQTLERLNAKLKENPIPGSNQD